MREIWTGVKNVWDAINSFRQVAWSALDHKGLLEAYDVLRVQLEQVPPGVHSSTPYAYARTVVDKMQSAKKYPILARCP